MSKVQTFLDSIGGINHVKFAVDWPFGGHRCCPVIRTQEEAAGIIPRVLITSPCDYRVIWAELSGHVDFTPWLKEHWRCNRCRFKAPAREGWSRNPRQGWTTCPMCWNRGYDIVPKTEPRPDWLILSGSPSEPTDLDGLRRVIADFRAAGVPVWVRNIGRQPVGSREPGRPATPWELSVTPCLADPTGSDPAEWPADLRCFEVPPTFDAKGDADETKSK